jgi:hypothetical protein
MAEAIEGGRREGNSGNFLHRVSDRREGGLQPSLLGTGRQRDAGLRTSLSQLGGG